MATNWRRAAVASLRAWYPWLLISALALAAFLLWLLLPKWQVHGLQIANPKIRADVEDNFRKTITQLLGGLAVLVGAGIAYLQLKQQQRTARDLLISNQVAKGFELLGNKDKDTLLRLGGIYALEGVMNTSEQYYKPVLETLCSLVRDETRTKEGNAAPATEIQAALTAIGRRKRWPGVGIMRAVSLTGSRISKADLSFANLSGAELLGVQLQDAQLNYAHLDRAFLNDADMRGASMQGAILTATRLARADLRGAQGLTEGQLDQAYGNEHTKLDPPLKIKIYVA
jgi:hypothetical protein